jgi:hypothetical protein
MQPLDATMEDTSQGQVDRRRREPFVRQVEDHSLPAGQVLIQQREGLGPTDVPPVFVP